MSRFLIVGTQRVPFLKKLAVAEAALNGDFDVLPEHNRKHALEFHAGNKLAIGFRRLFRSSDKWLLHPALSPALYQDRLEAHLDGILEKPTLRMSERPWILPRRCAESGQNTGWTRVWPDCG